MSQYLRDALKQMRVEGEAWLDFGEWRLRIGPVSEIPYYSDGDFLVRVKRRKGRGQLIVISRMVHNRGLRVYDAHGYPAVPERAVLARVLEKHERIGKK